MTSVRPWHSVCISTASATRKTTFYLSVSSVKTAIHQLAVTYCRGTHIVALLPPSSSLSDSTTTLSLSFLSFSRCKHSFRSQFQTKRSFPSRHLNKSIHATSHAYQICQLTNGGQVEQREFCIKKATFPAWGSVDADIKKKIHQPRNVSFNIKKG